MKVCHMTSVHNARDVRIFHKMCKSLAAAGYDVFLVAPGDSFTEDGVQVLGVEKNLISRFERLTRLSRVVYQKALEVDADVYHFHDPELLPYGLKLKKRGKKVIFDSHENSVVMISGKEWIPRLFRTPLRAFLSIYQKYVCHRIDAVVSVTPDYCEMFKDMGASTCLVSNFPIVDPNTPYQAPDFIERSIGFSGGISPQWQHEIILKALERLKDTTYLLAGPVSKDYLTKLQDLPAWKQTNYLGQIPYEQVPQMLSQVCVGMALLQYSPWLLDQKGSIGNTKLFEYMLSGIPVISTDFESWRPIVEGNQCGICVKPDDVDSVANAISYLLEHPDKARRMGENGRRAVLEKYNWGNEEQKLLALYQSLLQPEIKAVRLPEKEAQV